MSFSKANVVAFSGGGHKRKPVSIKLSSELAEQPPEVKADALQKLQIYLSHQFDRATDEQFDLMVAEGEVRALLEDPANLKETGPSEIVSALLTRRQRKNIRHLGFEVRHNSNAAVPAP